MQSVVKILSANGLVVAGHMNANDGPVKLTAQQESILEQTLRDPCTVIQGKAGAGKTTLIHALVKRLGATASAETFVHFLKLDPTKAVADGIAGFRGVRTPSALRRFVAIVVDEAFMVPACYLALLDKAMRLALRSEKPFGGVRLVLVGDRHQLPPVINDSILKSTLYARLAPVVHTLCGSMRQRDDPEFVAFLDDVRGAIAYNRPLTLGGYLDHTLNRRPAGEFVGVTPTVKRALELNCAAAKEADVRYALLGDVRDHVYEGCPVRVTRNIYGPSGKLLHFNGQLGTYVRPAAKTAGRTVQVDGVPFVGVKGASIVRIDGREVTISMQGKRHGVASAVWRTIHSLQGMTINGVLHVDFTRYWRFDPRLFYVAITRVPRGSLLCVTGISSHDFDRWREARARPPPAPKRTFKE